MNIVLLEAHTTTSEIWSIRSPRQLQHLQQHLQLKVGDQLKVGVRDGQRYLTEVIALSGDEVQLKPIASHASPAKLPVNLIVAMPRPKVLRRLIMDSVTLGVEKIVLLHSYRVDKSYWQSPLLKQIDDYVTLGLEQAGDTRAPQIEIYQRFKPFVEDVLPQMISDTCPAYVAHPYAKATMPASIRHGCSMIIGPEGGFIPYEIELLSSNGAQALSLGARILRTETAIPYVLGRLFAQC